MSAEAPAPQTAKAKKHAKPSVHPPVAEMVKAAVTNLKEKKGSSLPAIKKYVVSNYTGIDMTRLAPFIRKFLKKAVDDGVFEQVKGTGAAGSFRLSAKAKTAPKIDKKAAAKKTATKKPATKKPKSDKPKKIGTKKSAEKKSPKKTAKKTEKKTATKKPAAKKPTVKKPATKKLVAKKPATKKTTEAKKPAAKK